MTTENKENAQPQQIDSSKPILRYRWEYKNFLEYVKKHKIQRAIIYAKTLGIYRRTMSNWANQPELRKALAEAVDAIIDSMEKAGERDWRMHYELLKLCGLNDKDSIDLSSSDGSMTPTVIIEKSYGNKPSFRTTNETSAETS